MKRKFAFLILLSVPSIFLMFSSKDSQIEYETTQQNVAIEVESTTYETLNLGEDNTEQETENDLEETENELEVAIEKINIEIGNLSSIEDNKERFIAYKQIIEKYAYISVSPTTIYDVYSANELELLFKVVQAEIGNYTFDQICNVVSVIYNRLKHDRFPNTLCEILTPDQFKVIRNGAINQYSISEDTILACEYVFIFGDTTNGALFFDSNGKLKSSYNYMFNDGAHNYYNLAE